MVMPIQSLANIEYYLYGNMPGGYGSYNAPSIMNGYCAMSQIANQYPPAYFNNYPSFKSSPNNQTLSDTWESSFKKADVVDNSTLLQKDFDTLGDYYAKNNVLEEGFKGAALGGFSWMAFEHAQSLFHPINAFFGKNSGVKAAENIFKGIPKEFMKENSVLLQEAYTAAQQATRDTGKKWFFSGWLRKPINRADIEPLLKDLENALKSKDPKSIALATERLQAARGFDGKLIPGKKLSVAERLAKKSAPSKKAPNGEIAKNVEGLLARNSGKFGTIAKNFFKKDFLGFMLFETVFSIGKITTAFKKDTETGLKQTGQSLGKAALGTAGFCLGRAGGALLGAKLGAAIGSVCPGLGTLAGGLIGFTVGSIGMWLGHKIGEKVLGNDVANKVEAEELAKTAEGQVELLKFTMQKAEEGKTIPPSVQEAFVRIANQYSTSA